MAVVAITTKMVAGVKYTHTTADSADWSSVANDTYFYDLATEIVYYKNTEGAVIGQYEDTNATATTGSVISFATSQIYNSVASPSTSDITDDLTGAKIKIVQKIYHNHSVAPTFPAGWVRMGSGNYVTSVLNVIFCEWVSGTRVEYWINQEA
jgi:hypothetical protein